MPMLHALHSFSALEAPEQKSCETASDSSLAPRGRWATRDEKSDLRERVVDAHVRWLEDKAAHDEERKTAWQQRRRPLQTFWHRYAESGKIYEELCSEFSYRWPNSWREIDGACKRKEGQVFGRPP